VAICAIPPLAAPFKGRKESVARRDPLVLASVNAWLAMFAASRGLAFVDFHALLVDPEGRFTRDLTDDGLHPNEAGYQKMGEALAPILATLVAGPDAPARSPAA
jgi:lysophospholipase L1-like esterase